MKNPKLKIVIASDLDYEELIAEIYCDGRFIALLSQDKGPNDLELVFAASGGKALPVNLAWLLDAVERARKKLLCIE